MITKQDQVALAACIGGTLVTYQLYKYVSNWYSNRNFEWVPVGRIKELYVYPVKSCKAKKVFSLYCDSRGGRSGENRDRTFMVVNEKGHFFTARAKPQMVLVECDVRNGFLHLTYKDKTAKVCVEDVLREKRLVNSTLFSDTRTDGYDCGEEAAEFFADVIDYPGARLVMFAPGLYTERTCVTQQDWWNNNEVPKRKDEVAFPDLSPFMISSQASLDAVSEALGRQENPLQSVQLRANIVIEGCPKWDEDKWLDLRIGDVQLQCFCPCTRCIFSTIDPVTGEKDKEQQPLKKLKEIRLAPEGKMRKTFGESPMFGVNAGVDRKGYIHEGQLVWVKYKKQAH